MGRGIRIYKQILVRSDQEPAIVRLKTAFKRELGDDMICEEAPARGMEVTGRGEHTNSGFARAATDTDGRSGKPILKAARWNQRDEPMDGAAFRGNHHQVQSGKDGRTA